ncbi:MAG TPA: VWA domain-containing protein [Hanamia sp.]|nr:VWA domain-containing protein [Hanamia sp.]
MLHFQYIQYFIALVAVPLMIFFYFLIIKWKKKTERKIGDPRLVKELTSQYSSKKFSAKFILFIAAFVLCAFAVAGLVKPDGTQKINRKDTDLMIALDVSNSMLANDIQPSRLVRAKQLISKIIDNLPDDRIGLVIFAGRAYLQMPLTIDHEAAKMYLSIATPADVPTQGTVFSDALQMCEASFNPNDKTFKSVLLISDGGDHGDDAIKVTKQLAKEGIMVNTVGIGSPEGAPILNPSTGQYLKDDKGQTVIAKLNQKELSDIAEAGHGIYQLYSNTDAVAAKIKKQLSGIATEANSSDSSYTAFKQYFQFFLGAAFILLLIEFFLSEKKKVRLRGGVAMMFFMALSLSSFSQSANSSILKGNKAYQKNNYNEAADEYRDALKNSENNVTADYNLGNALYRKNNTDEAVESYDNAIAHTSDSALKQKAFYNKGVALQKAKKLPECINAYENALILNPNDEDARQNLQRALKEQNNQKQNQKQNKNKNKNKNKKKKKQQPKQQPQNNQQKNNQQQPPPPKISKQDAIEKLKSLLENEKQLQDKMQKMNRVAVPNSPEKNW